MLSYPSISPEILSVGPVTIRWYGAMYLCGFIAAWVLGRYRLRRHALLNKDQFEAAITWAMLGVVVGARIGYVLFYDFATYLDRPLEIFFLWQGGMSFHGGLLGVLVGVWFAARRFRMPFFVLIDFFAPLVPPGLFFGRIGNFINGELWGRVTTSPLGMVFPYAGDLPRHPSQLYEAALEGLVLFCILWIYSSKPRPVMAVSGVFAIGYSVFRMFVEFFREPDAHIGYIGFNMLTMGMVLCIPLLLVGLALLITAYRKPQTPPAMRV